MRGYFLTKKTFREALIGRFSDRVIEIVYEALDLPPNCTYWEYISAVNELIYSVRPDFSMVKKKPVLCRCPRWPKMELCFKIFDLDNDEKIGCIDVS